MTTVNIDDLPTRFIYLTTEDGLFLTTEDGIFIILDYIPETSPYQGSGGNRLLTSSVIVDMGSPGQFQNARQAPPRERDRKGNRIYWDD